MSFAGKEITSDQINERSELAKERKCVSCGSNIKRGHICDCQAEGAINCPRCKRNIKNPRCATTAGPSTAANVIELRIHCNATKGCDGHLYSYAYLEDFVPFNPGA